jgi:SEC-C motif-containing protein
MSLLTNSLCLCGSQHTYADCCEPLILNKQAADTPEQLMRSRYTAYAIKNAKYVYQTYASSAQSANPVNEISDFANSCRFINLDVITCSTLENTGFVEFKAQYFYQNLFCELHEKSKFIKEHTHWRYLNGDIFPVADKKISRNDNCPCNSGKKYKKCHSI